MSKAVTVSFSQDELEILVDALEADLEGYVDSAKDARANGNRADVATFTEAGDRIRALIVKLQAFIPD
jgi:hypothetical protein